MYIRVKTIKKQEYGYLVQSKWNKKQSTSKQKFSQYLGRVYSPQKQYSLTLKDVTKAQDIENYVKITDVNQILNDIITVDLLNHNLKRNRNTFSDKEFYVDISNLKVYNKKLVPCVVKINNGYLCDYTLKRLFNIKPSNTDEVQFGKELARAVIEAGIGIEKELFVLVFDKLYKKEVI